MEKLKDFFKCARCAGVHSRSHITIAIFQGLFYPKNPFPTP